MDGYISQSNFLYYQQQIFSPNLLWQEELNLENHRSMVYYSVSEFKDPVEEFEEYDPTPYGGGYDQALTYGKPLPPSDAICYPLSTTQPTQPISPPLQEPSYGSTNPPNGGEEEEVDHSRSLPSTEEDHPSYGVGEDSSSHGGGYGVPGSGYEYDPLDSFHQGWSDYGCGDGYGRGQETQAPEYGFCEESLFGYWPCLSKRDREQRRSSQQQQHEENCYGDQWRATAEYLFGSNYPYGEVNSGYGSYYQQQHSYKQNECKEPPLLVQNASYYQACPPRYIDGEDAYFNNQIRYYDE